MKRSRLKQIAKQVARNLASKGYEYWYAPKTDDELTPEYEADGQQIQIEISVLERNESYVQIGVSASDGGFWASHFPPGFSEVIEKNPN